MSARVEVFPTLVTRTVPDWVIVVAGYAVSRVLTTVILAVMFTLTQHWSASQYDGHPGFLGFLQSWDARWYERIVVDGYPEHVPHSDGQVDKNTWAFLPLFPLIVRVVSTLTGIAPGIMGIVVAVIFGLAAALALHRLLAVRFGAKPALWGAMFFCFGPLSFVLQMGYAEGLYLLLMFLALLAFLSHRYLLMIPYGVLASFAHPGALALAAGVGIVGLIKVIRREPIPARDVVAGVAAIVTIGAAGLAWPLIAGAVTGYPGAYFATELAWWRDYLGPVHFVPFMPWFALAVHNFGYIGIPMTLAVIGVIAWLVLRRQSRVLGVELLAYSGSYLVYLIAVFLPQQSIVRMLLPLAPVLGTPTLTATPLRRWSVLLAGIALQPVAILLLWVLNPP